MDKRNILFGLAAVAFMAVMIHFPAFAAESGYSTSGGGGADGAGTNALSTLTGVLTGNIGLMIGLAITVAGLWTWIIGQKTGAGIVMIIGGVLLTLAPGLFNGVRDMGKNVVTTFSGGNYDTVQDQK